MNFSKVLFSVLSLVLVSTVAYANTLGNLNFPTQAKTGDTVTYTFSYIVDSSKQEYVINFGDSKSAVSSTNVVTHVYNTPNAFYNVTGWIRDKGTSNYYSVSFWHGISIISPTSTSYNGAPRPITPWTNRNSFWIWKARYF